MFRRELCATSKNKIFMHSHYANTVSNENSTAIIQLLCIINIYYSSIYTHI